ncbi:tRNA (N6-isopentenyl adenosine(37)-C2)-methylthiotransferase MiaB [Desulfovibrio aminophilus]|uniref:tRNA (N6-isopentenyl adenosine(37)-C2)-methylthiotransferase MiaB n=1 Tax=Desulfovibrio aminophilus TaxID=81425 RepID=UPI003392DA07
MKFHIITFGCQMNANDSDWLARALESRGWEQTDEEAARVFILNTCSVREKPEQKVYSVLGRLERHLRRDPGVFAAVGGCVAQQVGAGFFERFPFVRLVVGTDAVALAPDALERLAAEPETRLALLDFLPNFHEREEPEPRLGVVGPAQAFVNIMQGCDNFCAYCIVPYVRGRQKSRRPEAVLAECRSLVERGARELTLLGQNVNSFGLDSGGVGVSFAELLRQVAAIPGLERLRFTTSHPKDLAPDVVRAFGELDNLCPSLHLPLQSGSDAVLRRMGRRYDRARYLDLVRRLRSARPDLALTTDLIVGFPGETEEDFAQTLEMMRQVGFESSFSFKYSDRPGVAATRMELKVAEDVASARLEHLQNLQNTLTKDCLENCVGSETVVLIEGPSRKQDGGEPFWRGRDPAGRTVNVAHGGEADLSGKMIPVRLVEAKKHSLIGEKAGVPW